MLREEAMTCSRCDKKIPLVRGLTGSKYCCVEHEKLDAEFLHHVEIQRLLTASSADHSEAPALTRKASLQPATSESTSTSPNTATTPEPETVVLASEP